MLRHVAVFRWKPGTTPGDLKALGDGLSRLPATIPEIADYRFGSDARLADGNWDYAVVADFEGREGYEVYRDHPAHQQLISELVAPIISERAAVQYEPGGRRS